MTSARLERPDPLSAAILYAPLLGITILGKVAVHIGDSELLIGVPVIIAATGIGIVFGRLRVQPQRMAAYLGVAAIAAAQQVLAVDTFSVTSLLLLIVLHAAYGFRLEGLVTHSGLLMRRLLDLAFFLCLCGIAQYIAQFVVGKEYAFPIEHFAPDWLLTEHYNMLIPMRYGSAIYKANGIFMAEPSFFSQLLAAGFICEAIGPRRLWRLGCFCAALVVTYSGTGLLMLAAAIPVLIIVHRRLDLLIFFGVVAVVLLSFSGPLGMDLFVERMGEFRDPNASGYLRYTGGIHLFDQYLWSEPRRWLFGVGSGMMMRMTPQPFYNVSETGWVKLIIEYGLIGAGAYFSFLYYCVFSSRQPLVQRVCLGVTPLLSGILDPGAHGMLLTLLVWLPGSASATRSADDVRRGSAAAATQFARGPIPDLRRPESMGGRA